MLRVEVGMPAYALEVGHAHTSVDHGQSDAGPSHAFGRKLVDGQALCDVSRFADGSVPSARLRTLDHWVREDSNYVWMAVQVCRWRQMVCQLTTYEVGSALWISLTRGLLAVTVGVCARPDRCRYQNWSVVSVDLQARHQRLALQRCRVAALCGCSHF